MQWSKGKKTSFRFGVPVIWREPRNHSDDCYFFSCKVQGYNSQNRKEILYPKLPFALRPVPHGPGIPVPVPVPPETLEDTPVDSDKEDTDSDQDFQCDPSSTEPELFSSK
jgi:hypothetical protein